MIDRSAPFILLDDARATGAVPARLYSRPVEIFTAQSLSQIRPLLDRLRAAQARGLHAAGYLAYEAGAALDRIGAASQHGAASSPPLAWFGLFEDFAEIAPDTVLSLLPDPAGAQLGEWKPEVSLDEYLDQFAKVQDYIRAGDIYQANLTFRALASFCGDPLSLYAALRPRAAAGYGGIVYTGDHWHLSFSPELFFALKEGHVTTKPMKGTASRSTNVEADAAVAAALAADPKQRAENLMIVDLLRNDLSRVCVPGSVQVPQLFAIESYPTIHQMISVVSGALMAGKDALDLVAAIFPCGSITGAPKIRAMQIIDEVEASPRQIYCGSIGRIDPDGSAAFNVAIRTLSMQEGAGALSLGLGSGVVADSQGMAEWQECLAKGEFARVGKPAFDLVETMRFEPDEGIIRLELHLARMKESAAALGFAFDRHAARNALHAASFHLDKPTKLRLLLSPGGAISIEARPAPAVPASPLSVALVRHRTSASDLRRHHKTTDRGFYDEPRRDSPADEVVFVNEDGSLTEGSFTALFVERGGRLLTPPQSCGLLPSVLRAELLAEGRAIEADLTASDLSEGFFVGNSLRGLLPASLMAKDISQN